VTKTTTVFMMSSSAANDHEDVAHFGKFIIPSDSIFYRSRRRNNGSSKSTFAFVNLRPIVPGHVLVVPERIVPHLSDLDDEEYADLWHSVRDVQGVLQRHYGESGCSAFNVAVQDGKAAGQSVPHVHVHVLPRHAGDAYEDDDRIYNKLEEWAPRDELVNAIAKIDVPDDADRKDRTREEMAEEAAAYRKIAQEQQPS